ncbi:transcription factor bHLH18-like [Olea europaea var. sylvestris]|uniref:Transcription factor bHLH18-like n=1 Tax=Olea europaea subsp. europaea TaxID=158383 RepID=A0A8S0UB96_OLEEU|nr:transcription factor bHLH18-like [Olea europaea var. sylvestris]XP_022872708.1 transcription factor bHLH18-like [Olea europaea var. sylvestris]CAA3014850.1 transcription factor bHLH18-like [Olea europaea subsp. europaea]
MDISAASCFSEMVMDNSIFEDQIDFLDTFDEELNALLGEDLSPGNNSSSSLNLIPSCSSISSLCTSPGMEPPQISFEPPPKQQKPNNYYDYCMPNFESAASTTPIILNFSNSNSPTRSPQQYNLSSLNPEEKAAVSEALRSPEEVIKTAQTTKKNGRVRPPSQTYDHIIAERKRRELLSQRFVALSALVPGLKKVDKTSVLGDAIKYVKHLQERVKAFEEQAAKQTVESVVLVKKSKLLVEDDGSSDENNSSGLPEIEAKVCNNHILLRIHCEKHKGILSKLLAEVERLHLSIVNVNASSFGSFALDITINAEMEKESSLSLKEVVRTLRLALQRAV